MFIGQLPVEKAIESAGSIVDTALHTSPKTGNGYGIALATPYIFLFVIVGLAIYAWHITRKDKQKDEEKREAEADEKRQAFADLRNDVKGIGEKFEQRTKGLEAALREDSTAIRGILADHNTRLTVLEMRLDRDQSA